jgi:hypothetical protein
MLLALPAVSQCLAQSSGPVGVDLIILIDQSASMSGTVDHNATDPYNNRVTTAKYLIEYLHFDGAYVNEERANRVTVLGFGSPDETHTLVGLTEVETANDVEQAQARIVSENLGNTSFISALRLVREQFPPATDSEPRQRIIVIITDGGPYDARTNRANDPFTYGDYFSEIDSYYTEQLGADTFPLYVIGVDEENLYWSNVVRYWDRIAGDGHAVRVEEIEEANREIVRLLCPLMNPNQPEDYCALADLGPHFVQPYASLVQFSFFKYDPEAEADLYAPGEYPGNPISLSSPDVEIEMIAGEEGDARDEIYRISNPEPGCWMTDRQGTGQVDVFVQVAFHSMEITSPSSAHPQVLPLTIELELLDDQGNPVSELPEYPVELVTQLFDAEGQPHPIQVQHVGDGVYRTTSPMILNPSGFYTLTMEGYTTVGPSVAASCITSTQDIPIFERKHFQLYVSEPALEVLNPELPALRYGPIDDLQLGFVDPDGNLLSIPEDVPWTMRVHALTPDGSHLDLPTPEWDDGRFIFSDPVFLPENGSHILVAELTQDSGQTLAFQTPLTVTENVRVVSPGENHPVHGPLRMVEVELRDENDQAIELDPTAYPLDLIARVYSGENLTQEVILLPTEEPGRYRRDVSWVFENPGQLDMEILGNIRTRPGDSEQAFVVRREIEVSPYLPYFRVISPDETEENPTYPLHHWYLPPFPFGLRDMPIRVELLHEGERASASEFFISPDIDQLFTAEVSGPGIERTVQLRDVSANEQVFGANLEDFEEEGIYTATIQLDGSVVGGVPTEGAWQDVVIAFEVSDPPLYPIAWWSFLVLLAAVTVTWIGWQVTNRWILSPARGKLIMERRSGGEIDSKSLVSFGRNRFTISGRKLGNLLQLKKVQVRRVQPMERRARGSTELVEGISVVVTTEKGEEVSGEIFAQRVRGRRDTLTSPALKTRDGDRYQIRYEN